MRCLSSSKKEINTFCVRNSGSKFPSKLKSNSAKKKKFEITKNGFHLKLKLHQLWWFALSRVLFISNDYLVTTCELALTALQLFCYCHSLFRQAHCFGSTHEQEQLLLLCAVVRMVHRSVYLSFYLVQAPVSRIKILDLHECLSPFTTSNPTFWRFWAKNSKLHPCSPFF